MIESSIGFAGMTECLINLKYVLFGQPNQMDGKYCLSWQAGQSINLCAACVGRVASTDQLAPTITFVLLLNRHFLFHPEIKDRESRLLIFQREKPRSNIFFRERRSVST